MLKNFGYDGVYRNQDLSINVLLENPLDYGFEAATLVFSVTIKGKKKEAAPRLRDFAFYIMDEQNNIYNMQKATIPQSALVASLEEKEPIHAPDALISTDFRPEFLFQNLRIALYCGFEREFHIIELKH